MTETLSTAGLKLLCNRVVKERDMIASHLIDGKAQSFEQYRYEVGRVFALSCVLSWCEETEKDLFEGKT